MKKLKMLLPAYLFLMSLLYGQATDFPIDLQENYFSSNIFSHGMGNLGFDNPAGFFNPHAGIEPKGLKLLIAGNILGGYSEQISRIGTTKEGRFTLLPDLNIAYTDSWYKVQLHLMNTLLSSQNNIIPAYPIMINNGKGYYSIDIGKPQTDFFNYSFQLDVSFKLDDAISVSAGTLTNYFKKKLSLDDGSNVTDNDIIYVLNPFKSFQYLASLNYSSEDFLKIYAMFKSKSFNNNVAEDQFRISPNAFVNLGGTVSFPGTFAAGFQLKPFDFMKLSLEYYDELNTSDKENDTKMIIPGINVRFNKFELGLMFALQVSKAEAINYTYSWGPYTIKSDNTSYLGAASVSYKMDTIELFLQTQFMNKYYFADGPGDYSGTWEYAVKNQIIRLGAGINLL